MLLLKIKRAETALADGRLDEAFTLARTEPVREHRRGQRLLTRLTRRLLERGRGHLAAQRSRDALADCAKAEQLAGNTDEVARLRAEALRALHAADREKRQRDEVLTTARERMAAGQLSMAEGVLDGLSGDSGRVETARRDLAQRREMSRRSIDRAEAALRAGDELAAIDHLLDARRTGAPPTDLDPLTAVATQRITARIQDALMRGRLDGAERMLHRLTRLAGHKDEVQELSRILDQCHEAARWMRSGRPRRAATILHQLRNPLPGAAWLEESVRDAERAAEHLESMRRGPLGVLSPDHHSEAAGPAAHRREPQRQAPPTPLALAAPAPAISDHEPPPPAFIMHIDGVGGFIIATRPTLTLGPTGSSATPDLPLAADPNLPPLTVHRTDEDYFLQSDAPVTVNGKPTQRTLLTDGARIAWSPRCRLRFHRPNLASTTAVLDLGAIRLPRIDARRAVLLDRELILGPGSTAHIQARSLPAPIMLRYRDGRLIHTPAQAEPAGAIPLDVPTRIGPLSIVLKRMETG